MRRLIALQVIVLMLAAACGGGSQVGELTEDEGDYGSGIDLSFEDRDTDAAPVGDPGPQPVGPAGGAGHPAPVTMDAPADDLLPPVAARGPTDGGRPGNNAYFFMNAEVPRLVVEITAVEGFEPHDATIGLLRERLGQVADKPGGIDIIVSTVPRTSRSEWSMADIQDHERRHRQFSNSSQAAVIYLQFLNGEPAEGPAIGVAYSASAGAVFVGRIRSAASTPLVRAVDIERSTTIHEVGHLLALVNLTYRSPREREDSSSPGHSSNPNSVMFWAVEDVSIAGLLQGRTRPPTEFDADDLADLEDLKNGRLP